MTKFPTKKYRTYVVVITFLDFGQAVGKKQEQTNPGEEGS